MQYSTDTRRELSLASTFWQYITPLINSSNKLTVLTLRILYLLVMSALRVAMKQSRLCIPQSTFVVCDIQDKFRPLIHRSETVIKKAAFLNEAFKVLDIPCVITEHYSKALGTTVPDITKFPSTKVFEKREFSMMGNEAVRKELIESGRNQVIWTHSRSVSRFSHLGLHNRWFCVVLRPMSVCFNPLWTFSILVSKCTWYATPLPASGTIVS